MINNLIKYFKFAYIFLLSFFVDCHKQKLAPQNKQREHKPAKSKYDDLSFGEFATIKELLNDLDSTFEEIGNYRIKQDKTQVAKLIKRFGVYLSYLGYKSADDVCRVKLDGLKAYGSTFFFANHIIDYSDRSKRRLVVGAAKIDSIPFIKLKPGFVYYEACLLSTDQDDKITDQIVFYVEVNKTNGHVEPLEIMNLERVSVPGGSYVKKCWSLPKELTLEARRQNESLRENLRGRFILGYNINMRREYGVNIIIKKGKHKVTVNVPQHQWKYFFKERISVKTATGRQKPIFHYVSAHVRHTKNGDQNVKTHIRGERRFKWGAYDINIVLPGKHSVSQCIAIEGHVLTDSESPNAPGFLNASNIAAALNPMIDGKRDHLVIS